METLPIQLASPLMPLVIRSAKPDINTQGRRCNMRHIKIRTSRQQARNGQRGSALVGTAALMIVLGMMAMGLILLGVNIYSIVEYDSKLSFIARQTALASEKYQYWLGMKRMDYTDQSQIAAN